MVPLLLKYTPPHRVYYEPMLGSGVFLLNKPRAPLEVVNDVNGDVVNFFRVLRDRKGQRLQELLRLTPYARDEREACQLALLDPGLSDVERARAFFVMCETSMWGDTGSGFGFPATCERPPQATFASRVDRLHRAASRLRGVIVENLDFRAFFGKYQHAGVFCYLDPPYPPSVTRNSGYYARNEMSDDDHRDLVELLLGRPGAYMLSGWPTPLYEPLEAAGWERLEVQRNLSAMLIKGGAQRGQVTECLWLNPELRRRLRLLV